MNSHGVDQNMADQTQIPESTNNQNHNNPRKYPATIQETTNHLTEDGEKTGGNTDAAAKYTETTAEIQQKDNLMEQISHAQTELSAPPQALAEENPQLIQKEQVGLKSCGEDETKAESDSTEQLLEIFETVPDQKDNRFPYQLMVMNNLNPGNQLAVACESNESGDSTTDTSLGEKGFQEVENNNSKSNFSSFLKDIEEKDSDENEHALSKVADDKVAVTADESEKPPFHEENAEESLLLEYEPEKNKLENHSNVVLKMFDATSSREFSETVAHIEQDTAIDSYVESIEEKGIASKSADNEEIGNRQIQEKQNILPTEFHNTKKVEIELPKENVKDALHTQLFINKTIQPKGEKLKEILVDHEEEKHEAISLDTEKKIEVTCGPPASNTDSKVLEQLLIESLIPELIATPTSENKTPNEVYTLQSEKNPEIKNSVEDQNEKRKEASITDIYKDSTQNNVPQIATVAKREDIKEVTEASGANKSDNNVILEADNSKTDGLETSGRIEHTALGKNMEDNIKTEDTKERKVENTYLVSEKFDINVQESFSKDLDESLKTDEFPVISHAVQETAETWEQTKDLTLTGNSVTTEDEGSLESTSVANVPIEETRNVSACCQIEVPCRKNLEISEINTKQHLDETLNIIDEAETEENINDRDVKGNSTTASVLNYNGTVVEIQNIEQAYIEAERKETSMVERNIAKVDLIAPQQASNAENFQITENENVGLRKNGKEKAKEETRAEFDSCEQVFSNLEAITDQKDEDSSYAPHMVTNSSSTELHSSVACTTSDNNTRTIDLLLQRKFYKDGIEEVDNNKSKCCNYLRDEEQSLDEYDGKKIPNENDHTLVADKGNITDTTIVAERDGNRKCPLHEKTEESILPHQTPLKAVSDELDIASSGKKSETVTWIKHDIPIQSHKESFEGKEIEDNTGGNQGIQEEQDDMHTELGNNIENVEIELAKDNVIDGLQVDLYVSQTIQPEGEELEEVLVAREEEKHEATKASTGKEKKVEDACGTPSSTETTVLEHPPTGTLITELIPITTLTDLKVPDDVDRSESKEKLDIKNTLENIEGQNDETKEVYHSDIFKEESYETENATLAKGEDIKLVAEAYAASKSEENVVLEADTSKIVALDTAASSGENALRENMENNMQIEDTDKMQKFLEMIVAKGDTENQTLDGKDELAESTGVEVTEHAISASISNQEVFKTVDAKPSATNIKELDTQDPISLLVPTSKGTEDDVGTVVKEEEEVKDLDSGYEEILEAIQENPDIEISNQMSAKETKDYISTQETVDLDESDSIYVSGGLREACLNEMEINYGDQEKDVSSQERETNAKRGDLIAKSENTYNMVEKWNNDSETDREVEDEAEQKIEQEIHNEAPKVIRENQNEVCSSKHIDAHPLQKIGAELGKNEVSESDETPSEGQSLCDNADTSFISRTTVHEARDCEYGSAFGRETRSNKNVHKPQGHEQYEKHIYNPDDVENLEREGQNDQSFIFITTLKDEQLSEGFSMNKLEDQNAPEKDEDKRKANVEQVNLDKVDEYNDFESIKDHKKEREGSAIKNLIFYTEVEQVDKVKDENIVSTESFKTSDSNENAALGNFDAIEKSMGKTEAAIKKELHEERLKEEEEEEEKHVAASSILDEESKENKTREAVDEADKLYHESSATSITVVMPPKILEKSQIHKKDELSDFFLENKTETTQEGQLGDGIRTPVEVISYLVSELPIIDNKSEEKTTVTRGVPAADETDPVGIASYKTYECNRFEVPEKTMKSLHLEELQPDETRNEIKEASETVYELHSFEDIEVIKNTKIGINCNLVAEDLDQQLQTQSSSMLFEEKRPQTTSPTTKNLITECKSQENVVAKPTKETYLQNENIHESGSNRVGLHQIDDTDNDCSIKLDETEGTQKEINSESEEAFREDVDKTPINKQAATNGESSADSGEQAPSQALSPENQECGVPTTIEDMKVETIQDESQRAFDKNKEGSAEACKVITNSDFNDIKAVPQPQGDDQYENPIPNSEDAEILERDGLRHESDICRSMVKDEKLSQGFSVEYKLEDQKLLEEDGDKGNAHLEQADSYKVYDGATTENAATDLEARTVSHSQRIETAKTEIDGSRAIERSVNLMYVANEASTEDTKENDATGNVTLANGEGIKQVDEDSCVSKGKDNVVYKEEFSKNGGLNTTQNLDKTISNENEAWTSQEGKRFDTILPTEEVIASLVSALPISVHEYEGKPGTVETAADEIGSRGVSSEPANESNTFEEPEETTKGIPLVKLQLDETIIKDIKEASEAGREVHNSQDAEAVLEDGITTNHNLIVKDLSQQLQTPSSKSPFKEQKHDITATKSNSENVRTTRSESAETPLATKATDEVLLQEENLYEAEVHNSQDAEAVLEDGITTNQNLIVEDLSQQLQTPSSKSPFKEQKHDITATKSNSENVRTTGSERSETPLATDEVLLQEENFYEPSSSQLTVQQTDRPEYNSPTELNITQERRVKFCVQENKIWELEVTELGNEILTDMSGSSNEVSKIKNEIPQKDSKLEPQEYKGGIDHTECPSESKKMMLREGTPVFSKLNSEATAKGPVCAAEINQDELSTNEDVEIKRKLSETAITDFWVEGNQHQKTVETTDIIQHAIADEMISNDKDDDHYCLLNPLCKGTIEECHQEHDPKANEYLGKKKSKACEVNKNFINKIQSKELYEVTEKIDTKNIGQLNAELKTLEEPDQVHFGNEQVERGLPNKSKTDIHDSPTEVGDLKSEALKDISKLTDNEVNSTECLFESGRETALARVPEKDAKLSPWPCGKNKAEETVEEIREKALPPRTTDGTCLEEDDAGKLEANNLSPEIGSVVPECLDEAREVPTSKPQEYLNKLKISDCPSESEETTEGNSETVTSIMFETEKDFEHAPLRVCGHEFFTKHDTEMMQKQSGIGIKKSQDEESQFKETNDGNGSKENEAREEQIKEEKGASDYHLSSVKETSEEPDMVKVVAKKTSVDMKEASAAYFTTNSEIHCKEIREEAYKIDTTNKIKRADIPEKVEAPEIVNISDDAFKAGITPDIKAEIEDKINEKLEVKSNAPDETMTLEAREYEEKGQKVCSKAAPTASKTQKIQLEKQISDTKITQTTGGNKKLHDEIQEIGATENIRGQDTTDQKAIEEPWQVVQKNIIEESFPNQMGENNVKGSTNEVNFVNKRDDTNSTYIQIEAAILSEKESNDEMSQQDGKRKLTSPTNREITQRTPDEQVKPETAEETTGEVSGFEKGAELVTEERRVGPGPGSPSMCGDGDGDVKVMKKKSHNVLSGIGSKVKHSISKVKKAITGKPSKQHHIHKEEEEV